MAVNWSPEKYLKAAMVAKEVGDEMLSRLDWMSLKPQSILDIGCGVGETSKFLSLRYPDANIYALDLSSAMVNVTRSKAPQINCLCADGINLPLKNQSIDLMVANFFLPWQTNVKKILREWRRVLHPEGLLMFNMFGLDTLQEWHSVLPQNETPHLVDMHDVGDLLLQEGFLDPVLDVNYYTTSYEEKTFLFEELEASGMWFPETSHQMIEDHSAIKDTYQVTYEIINAHAFAPPNVDTVAAVEGVARIPLSSIRRQLKSK